MLDSVYEYEKMEYDSYECNMNYARCAEQYTYPRRLGIHSEQIPARGVISTSVPAFLCRISRIVTAHFPIPYYISSITIMDEVSDYQEDHTRPQKKRRKYIAKAWYVH